MPILSNAKHSGPPSLTSVEYLAFHNYYNPRKFDKKEIAAILGTPKGYGNFTQDKSVNLVRYYDSVKESGPFFKNLLWDLWNLICNPLKSLWGKVVLNLSTSHTPLKGS